MEYMSQEGYDELVAELRQMETVEQTASEFHILYAQLEKACGHAHGPLVALALAQQRLPHGRLDGDLALAQVHLVWAHDGVGHAAVVAQVGDAHLAQ